LEINLNAQEKRKKIGAEIVDMLRGAAMQFIVMVVVSASFLIFANAVDDTVIKIVATVLGELFVIAVCVVFGRQNGIYAYHRTLKGNAKREQNSDDIHAYFKTGEYAPWKGFVISFITTIPFLIFQIIYCIYPFTFVYFILQYAFAWGVAPFDIAGGIPQPVYLLSVIVPIVVHGVCYIWGGTHEKEKMAAQEKANQLKNRKKK
jgi:hypothetical protein